jgi:hypothetical protein
MVDKKMLYDVFSLLNNCSEDCLGFKIYCNYQRVFERRQRWKIRDGDKWDELKEQKQKTKLNREYKLS